MSTVERALWYQAWTATRFYFLIGFTTLIASTVALYMGFPDDYTKRFPNGALAVSVQQVRAVLHDGRAYIWLSWFGTSLPIWLSILALALSSAGLVKTPGVSSSPGVTYALSMPVSRRKLAGVRMAIGIIELAVAAILASLLICGLAPAQGLSFPVVGAIVHALLALSGATALYGLFVLLSATLGELAKGVLGGAILFLYGMFTFLTNGVRQFSVFRLMSGDTYFLSGEIPWLGILACTGFGLASIYAAVLVVERRDF
jgi:hypothetical protein